MPMPLPANTGGDFTPAPAGSHVAICIRVVDLGTQQTEYMGQPKHQHKIMIAWELPEALMDDGRPFIITQRYTWSSSEKAILRQHLESWRGVPFKDSDFGEGGFDIMNVVGVPCMLSVIHKPGAKGGTFANIAAIMKLPKGMPKPTPVNPLVRFYIGEKPFPKAVFDGLSDGLKAVIMKSPEYAVATGAMKATAQNDGHADGPDDGRFADGDSDIPF